MSRKQWLQFAKQQEQIIQRSAPSLKPEPKMQVISLPRPGNTGRVYHF